MFYYKLSYARGGMLQRAKRFHFFCFHEKLKFMGYPKSGPLKGKFIFGWRCPKCGKHKHDELWWRCGGFL